MTADPRDEIRAQIRAAFQDVPPPERLAELLPQVGGEAEPRPALAALLGRPWSGLAPAELFEHREALARFTPAGFQAYLPAYLDACVAIDEPHDRYGAGLRRALLTSLVGGPGDSRHRIATTAERLARLDRHQREVVALVIRYLVARWHSIESREALARLPFDLASA